MATGDIVQDTKDRVEQNKGLGTGERMSAEEALKQLTDLAAKYEAPTRGPASETTNSHPSPEESGQKYPSGDVSGVTSQMTTAAGALRAAITAMTAQVESDRRLMSDPRYERDQKILELARTGKLGLVPATEQEKAAAAARAGVDPEILKNTPSTPHEQVAQDMPRLQEAEKRAAATVLPPAVDESQNAKTESQQKREEHL